MDIVHGEEAGDAEAAGRGGDQAGHPVIAMDQVRPDAGDDVIDDLPLEGEGDSGVLPAVTGIDGIAVIKNPVFCEVDAFLRQGPAHGFEFLGDDFKDVGVEHLPVVRQGHMDIRAELEQRRDQRGRDIRQSSGFGVHPLRHVSHAIRQIGDFRGDDEDARFAHRNGGGEG